MRRAALCLCAASLALAPWTGVRASEAAVELQAHAAIFASTVNVQPRFDPAIADSSSAASPLGTSSIDGVAWPGFLVDAFFFLYGFQSVERLALGVTEAHYPQGPATGDATLSNLAFTNAGDPSMVPAHGGHSRAQASEGRASGIAAIAGVALPAGSLGSATSTSQTEGDTATATQTVQDFTIGPLHVETISGTASARAGAHADAEATLRVTGASVNGTVVGIDREGVHAQTASAEAAAASALATAGVSVRLVPAERSADGASSASSGGVLITIERQFTDPTPRDVRLALLLGSASAYARAGAEPAGAPRSTFNGPLVLGIVLSPAPPATGSRPTEPTQHLRRRIIVTEAAAGVTAGARGAYTGLVVIAFGLLLVRPLVRAATRP